MYNFLCQNVLMFPINIIHRKEHFPPKIPNIPNIYYLEKKLTKNESFWPRDISSI